MTTKEKPAKAVKKAKVEVKAEVKEEKVTHKNIKTARFSDAPWYKPGLTVMLGGAGSIGSHLAYYLGRQEAEVHIYDADVVNEINYAGQLFPITSTGKKKTEITKDMIALLSDNKNVHTYGKFDKDSMASEYMFSCFDNMTARKMFFEAWKAIETQDKVFIDGRTNAESFQVFIVTPDKISRYEEELFDDSKIPDLDCSYKSTTFCAAMVSSIMCSGFNNYMTNVISKNNVRDIPFKTVVNLSLFNFNIEI